MDTLTAVLLVWLGMLIGSNVTLAYLRIKKTGSVAWDQDGKQK
jgi:hypothetical protein